MLSSLGVNIDHTKLTYREQGRDFRLTDVFGKVVTGILASLTLVRPPSFPRRLFRL